jgi:hypothetical protein
MKKNDGGPAFPVDAPNDPCIVKNPGMSLRDYFAGQALAGLMANQVPYPTFNLIASKAYKAADSMIEEREK